MILKRAIDYVSALLGLVILSPVLLLISIAIKMNDYGPILYKQVRVGRYSKPFKIIKFRTMVNNAENHGSNLTVGKDPRITRIGVFLRRYKLDELPQLINVLKGEMSLVGPRPEVPEYVEYYSEEDKKIVHSVLPGITDTASIEYRNENELLSSKKDSTEYYISTILPKKINLYKKYVNERTLYLDLKLIMLTIFRLGH